jgi:sugar/nucleoside kinase (ribokinase family)
MPRARFDVVGIGNAIVDVLAPATDEFLGANSLIKGAMTLIDSDRAATLYKEMGPAIECSGGSAANTVVGIAALGGRTGYIGKVAADQLGSIFRHDINAAGVAFDTPAASSGAPTARCLVLITPDGQRTMQTYLGACAELTSADIDETTIAHGELLYLEGYLWDRAAAKEAFRKAIQIAHKHGRKVALTLSDAFCVERHRDEFFDLLHDVDVLFANEAEIMSLYRTHDFDATLSALLAHLGTRIAAVTRGAKGCVVCHDGRTAVAVAEPVDSVIDTTGAGDLYAAGFLYGLSRRHTLTRCARMGSIAAAHIISHMGARPKAALKTLIDAEESVYERLSRRKRVLAQ